MSGTPEERDARHRKARAEFDARIRSRVRGVLRPWANHRSYQELEDAVFDLSMELTGQVAPEPRTRRVA